MRRKLIMVDMDGTICNGVSFTSKDCLEAKPIQDIIDKVNKLYEENFIVIYTARRDRLIPASLEWLRRNGVHFHAFSNNKIPADVYLDDHAVHPSSF